MAGILAVATALPVSLGIIAVAAPAIGLFPALGFVSPSLEPAAIFLSTPGLGPAILTSLATGFGATLLALLFSFALVITFESARDTRWLRRLAGPLIAVPHSAVAIGVLFLLAPSGWLMRLVSPGLTGFERPPLWALVPDGSGAVLCLGLLVKEVPFLVLVSLAALATLPVRRLLATGMSLGYERSASWIYLVLPLVYRRIRLPVFAVLVFSLSVVDMPRLLGPMLPPPLAVLIVQGFENDELVARLPASFGALVQIAVTAVSLLIWCAGESLCRLAMAGMRRRGYRLAGLQGWVRACAAMATVPVAIGGAGLIAAALWSVAGPWFFPAALPDMLTFRFWMRIDSLAPALTASLVIAAAASCFAVALALLAIEFARVRGRIGIWQIWILAPILLPQAGFVPGLQTVLTMAWLEGTWLAMIWMHTLFILPYAWLILAPAADTLDRRHDHVAASLGAGAWRRYRRVTLPMLTPAIITTLFVGICVSVALYLPSLFAGAGRITTMTLEAVALASGGSRAMAGVATMLQLLIPILGFAMLQTLHRTTYGRFAGLRAGGLH
ncbi:ABC transporter permease [Alphaproteobacteria bacterium LSUCC0719]